MNFKVTDKPFLEENPELASIPEFQDVPDRTLKWIALTYDYKSLYRGLPLEQRKDKAAFKVGFKREKDYNRWDRNARNVINGTDKKAEAARKAYLDLIYDSDRDTLQSIDDLIENIKQFIREPSSKGLEMDKKVKLAQSLPELAETRKKLAQLLGVDYVESDEDITEQKSLSTLEMVQEGLM